MRAAKLARSVWQDSTAENIRAHARRDRVDVCRDVTAGTAYLRPTAPPRCRGGGQRVLLAAEWLRLSRDLVWRQLHGCGIRFGEYRLSRRATRAHPGPRECEGWHR